MPSSREWSALRARAFTLIELLVVVAIIGLLVSILIPSLGAARQAAQGTKCLANFNMLGKGISIYADEENGVLPGGRLPAIDDCNSWANIAGGRKFRPTFVAMMSHAVGAPPFDDPKACRTETDRFGERGDRQNYAYGTYLCPTVSTWTDERNGAYGYNYQFLGNSRLLDEQDLRSYKNWPVKISAIRYPGRTVAAGDSMGTAASAPPGERLEYADDARDWQRLGNEGFNLDPPRVDIANGEMASEPDLRTAVDPRHRGKGNVLRVDGSATAETLDALGYRLLPNGAVALDPNDGDNSQWSGTGQNVPWVRPTNP